jgi:integrase
MGKRGNLEGSIYQRKDGRWVAEMQTGIKDGKAIKRLFYAKTRAAVSERLKKALAQQQDGTLTANNNTKLQPYLEQWLEAVKVKPNTRASYKNAVKLHLSPHIGHVKLSALTGLHVKQLVTRLEEDERSVPTIQYALKVLRMALNEAMREDILFRNVADRHKVEPPTERATSRLKAWTPDIVKTFLEHPSVRLNGSYCLWYLALATGLRRGELLGLKWTDLNEQTGLIYVQRQVTEVGKEVTLEETKTEASVRYVPVTPSTVTMLEEQKHRVRVMRKNAPEWNDLDLIFPSDDGTPRAPRSVTKMFARVVKASGVPTITLHGTRHTTASILRRMTNDAKLVSTVLGHTDATFTDETYVHLSPADMKRAALDLTRLEIGN